MNGPLLWPSLVVSFLAASTTSLPSEVRASKCLATLGAVEHNFSSPAWPTGGREIDCHFNLNEACYAFVPASQPDSVEYGCEKRPECEKDGLKCVETAEHNGNLGKLCCCANSMCNLPTSVEKLLPTPRTAAPAQLFRGNTDNSEVIYPEDIKWWKVPLLFFVCFTVMMFFTLALVFWYIFNQLKLMNDETEEIDERIKTRLIRARNDALSWTKAKMERAAKIVQGEEVPPLEKLIISPKREESNPSTKDRSNSLRSSDVTSNASSISGKQY